MAHIFVTYFGKLKTLHLQFVISNCSSTLKVLLREFESWQSQTTIHFTNATVNLKYIYKKVSVATVIGTHFVL